MTEKIVSALIANNYHISCAESCTGGLVVSKLVEVAGVSEILDMSMVTYANKAKIEFLGVNQSTINNFGVVSEEVAGQMAIGIAKLAKADIGLATSGIAGPGGATATKPVGLVCFGIYFLGKVYTFKHVFKNLGRNYIREEAANFILAKLATLLGIK